MLFLSGEGAPACGCYTTEPDRDDCDILMGLLVYEDGGLCVPERADVPWAAAVAGGTEACL